MAKGDLPVLVGVGQSLSQWDGTNGPDGAPSPLSLMVDASKAALADSGAEALANSIDTIAVVRIFEDSIGSAPHPHGHNTNLLAHLPAISAPRRTPSSMKPWAARALRRWSMRWPPASMQAKPTAS